MRKTFLILITIFLTTSCGSYINKMHREFDRADNKQNQNYKPSRFAFYKGQGQGGNASQVSTENRKSLKPEVQRRYVPQREIKKRYTSDDLTDQSNGGSLWAGQGQKASLFTVDKSKKVGDIIQVNVMGKLKNEITMELKRAYPDRAYQKKKSSPDSAAATQPAAAATPATAPETAKGDEEAPTSGGVIYDKISSIIVEEINETHILLRGRKNVLFKNMKRMVEIQALVSRKDLRDDSVDSDDILESAITVLR